MRRVILILVAAVTLALTSAGDANAQLFRRWATWSPGYYSSYY